MKGYHKAFTYKNKKIAEKKAKELKPKFFSVKVKKGTVGGAWGRTKTCYRIWVK